MYNNPISVYAPNLRFRTERKESLIEEFKGRSEFSLTIVPAIESKNGPWGLWQTFYRIVKHEAKRNSPYFIFCEDDHCFTLNYSYAYLKEQIEEANRLHADLLSGGMAWMKYPVQMSSHLFWVSHFNGMQFTVIYNRLYKRILDCQTTEGYVTDIHLSFLAKRKFVMYPYISTQKEFGYSDATRSNAIDGRVGRFFELSQELLCKLNKVKEHYTATPIENITAIWQTDVSKFYLPAYAINIRERTDRRVHIEKQFEGHEEFHLHIIEACRHDVGAVGLWMSICKIITQAQVNGEDAVLICEDDHTFTPNYNQAIFMHQVMQAAVMGAQLLSGGIGEFNNMVPVGNGLYWVDEFWCTQFIVIFRNAFSEILNAHFGLRDTADGKLSEILTEKLVINPFISVQTDSGYSDVTFSNNRSGTIAQLFSDSQFDAEHFIYAYENVMHSEITPDTTPSIDDLIKHPGLHKLHLGCGHRLLPGWFNTDIEPTYGATFMDATQPFPLPNDSIDYIFAEHLLERISYYKVALCLCECWRTLKLGGILRITVTTIDGLIYLYEHPHSDDAQRYVKWSVEQQSSPSSNGREWAMNHTDLPMAWAMQGFRKRHKDLLLYDLASIKLLLIEAGFTNIETCLLGESSHHELNQLENQRTYIPHWIKQYETITIEATK